MSNLDHLVRTMAALQDERLISSRRASPVPAALGQHLLDRAEERRRAKKRTALACAAVLLIGAGAFVGLRRSPVTGVSTVATVRPQAGERIEASLLDVAVAFEDGSTVVLSSGGSLRTAALGPSQATLELERGRAHVHVVHRSTTAWLVRAGAYSVAVTGTRFRVDWQPQTGAFSVVVEEGRVRVSGGLLTQAVDISQGQSLALQNGHAARPESDHLAAPGPAPSPVLGPPSVEREPETAPTMPTETAASAPRRKLTAHRLVPSSWRAQADAGRYRDALAEAEREGFEGICRAASGSDLLTLSEAARYAGNHRRAEQALRAVRARFARGEDAAVAAFLLGRIAAEGRHNPADAARWFRTYLAERPDGRLNREAEGRLLESLAFMDRETARQAARAYLGRYPSGPHSAFARNLLGQ